ncbi:MAG TPA: hypothetical protein VFQ32_15540 [Ktedonobacterales bacterium]|nr:hypothetical protein [Ktedonobacterales bacterium]
MTPQTQLDGRSPATPAPSIDAPVVTPTAERGRSRDREPHELTFAERQGLAMGWLSVALGIFLLFGGLALWASVALSAGFGGWLISMAVMGVIVVAAIVAVAYFVIRPSR